MDHGIPGGIHPLNNGPEIVRCPLRSTVCCVSRRGGLGTRHGPSLRTVATGVTVKRTGPTRQHLRSFPYLSLPQQPELSQDHPMSRPGPGLQEDNGETALVHVARFQEARWHVARVLHSTAPRPTRLKHNVWRDVVAVPERT
eukprot:2381367-Pleurochrysis_carterae.AAC.1